MRSLRHDAPIAQGSDQSAYAGPDVDDGIGTGRTAVLIALAALLTLTVFRGTIARVMS